MMCKHTPPKKIFRESKAIHLAPMSTQRAERQPGTLFLQVKYVAYHTELKRLNVGLSPQVF